MRWWSWSARDTVEVEMFSFLAISLIVGGLLTMGAILRVQIHITSYNRSEYSVFLSNRGKLFPKLSYNLIPLYNGFTV